MNVRRALREGLESLAAAQVPSASTTAEVLLLHVLGRDRAFLYAHPEAELSLEQERAFRHLVRERATGKPTQYLTGRQEFWGLSLHVEPGVFIPRPETEHVVEVALAIVREQLRKPAARIVDVGTGTGCIALALARELPEAEIIATEISAPALAVARRNAEELNLAGRVQFLKSDLLEGLFPIRPELAPSPPRADASGGGEGSALESTRAVLLPVYFDLVISNPPYVSLTEVEQLPREVREHEPAEALFSPGDGLEVTRRLIEQATKLLVSGGLPAAVPQAAEGPALRSPEGLGGWLVLELGYQMASRVRALVGDAWTNVEITNDLRGIPRVLAAQRR